MREHHIRLVRRSQEAGALRADIEPTDMLVLTMSVQATLNLAATATRPDLYRRVLAIVLDDAHAAAGTARPARACWYRALAILEELHHPRCRTATSKAGRP